MIQRKKVSINSTLPGGWETAPPYGERLVINRQEQGGKGDKLRTGRGDFVEQVATMQSIGGQRKRRYIRSVVKHNLPTPVSKAGFKRTRGEAAWSNHTAYPLDPPPA